MEYARRIPELIEKHSGRYLVKGVVPTPIEGEELCAQRSVIIEFQSEEDAQSFLNERATTDLHDIWARTTKSRILLLKGCVE